MDEPQTPKPRRGCFFYGCIAGIVCLVSILVAGLLGAHLFKKFVNQYTDSQPAALPKVELSAGELEAVQRRVNVFQDAVSTGRPVPPLELTSQELNAIISSRPDFQRAKDKVYLRVEGDKLNAQVSVPVEQIGLPFKGRYLNGQATLNVSLQNGLLYVTPSAIEVKGKPLPDVYLEKLRHENLARGVNDNSKASIALNRLEKIDVKDGKVILVPKVER